MNLPFTYKLHTPSQMEPGKKYPAVFALHGIGYNEEDILALVEDLKEDFILLGVRGHLPYENGYAYYYMKEYGKPERVRFDASIQLLTSFIDYASFTYPIDPAKRYLIGFSQGAVLSMSLALVLGDAIRGVGAMHGYIPAFVKDEYPLKPIADTSFFLADGQFDPIFPVTIGRENDEYLRQHSSSVTYTTYPVGHEISPENQRDLVKWLHQDSLKGGEASRGAS
ncbi:alpha/beta hydrolase [Brevibacillus centrosporus]|jgi:phospholipase/carboxylesterase|uniref:Phospholipase/carboxylesterase n=1 Tax=Brevibacillus centrosporus TaxID=54910 RepID=A0A1I3ZDT1_9BACL|nr:alpha/beta hydrolase-fold protein [Brevibacillus centrosporus]MEC2132900.1 alpha/beta hydrolase-fold protein [Brevibacillus centrosporus]MED4911525.1 alpha/beta hydrolase-fold protein [Brevibacillus centrosporus]RNB64234.1 esterase [Brevibacillus centrosporus]SFK41739.1 phospholipase/carboxylesterase [Brevibacillus centrosporus]GED35035.1 phospholipase [Brevibacillus centrosporus]